MEQIRLTAKKVQLPLPQLTAIAALFHEGATIPFIARYRKEKTGGINEARLFVIQQQLIYCTRLVQRKQSILSSLDKRELLSQELQHQIEQAETIEELEDVYLPFKPKRVSRAARAKKMGLLPLAEIIWRGENPETSLAFFQKRHPDETAEHLLSAAVDIVAERIAEHAGVRKKLRSLFHHEAILKTRVVKSRIQQAGVYKNYFNWEEPASKAAAHRIHAMFRAANEGVLNLKLRPDSQKAHNVISHVLSWVHNLSSAREMAIAEAYKRLLLPALENELKKELRLRADKQSLKVFQSNLEQLLMAPPYGQHNVLAIDPGFRSGCKVVCLDAQGNLQHNETIFPHPPRNEWAAAKKKIRSLVNAYQIEAIAVGNGTAGRETEQLIRQIRFDREVLAVMVPENGASVYSASALAREEFPQHDVVVRGAVSIGRRLMDPLAEFVKIDPKSLGVGQYQHDVDPKLLEEALNQTVSSCVNRVGVDLNTASKELLLNISGLNKTLASAIVSYRNENGAFKSRDELKKVKGLGPKAFENAAGFLRIRGGNNLLDNTAVHPERYALVEKMARDAACTIQQLTTSNTLRTNIQTERYIDETTGLQSILDILAELAQPGRDPRSSFTLRSFDPSLKRIEDIRPGQSYPGLISNITDFGAFVDIGVKVNGLIHKSEIADAFVVQPADHLKLNQWVQVRVLSVDPELRRIELSLRKKT